MNSSNQYIDLYEQARDMIFRHSTQPMNAVRDAAFEDFKRLGLPNRKVARAQTFPSGSSTRTSDTNPSRCPLFRQMTSLD